VPTYFLTAYTLDARDNITAEVATFETHSRTSALRWSDDRETTGLYVGVQVQRDDRAGLVCRDLTWLRNLEG
jgi:hypothetical protein